LLATANRFSNNLSLFTVAEHGTLSNVPGSPIAIVGRPGVLGGSPRSVAFSPGGGLLATANLSSATGDTSGNNVSVFGVAGAPTLAPVSGSPFSPPAAPAAAFTPSRSRSAPSAG
jgi:hypothetical protein